MTTGSIAMGLGLYLPEEVQEEIEAVRRSGSHYDVAERFRVRLKQIDARLDLIWVKRGATSFPVPGRWYIVRRTNDGAAAAFWVVQDDRGRYCDPTDQHLERLQAMDSHAHPDVWRRMQRTRRAEDAGRKKATEEKRREFRETLLERLDFNNRVQIPVTGADKAKIA